MRLTKAAAILLTLCGAGCGHQTLRLASMDPAKLQDCPRTLEYPGDLPSLHPFKLPDGREVVPLQEVRDRDNVTARGALILRGGYVQCRSVVIYAEDWQKAAKVTR